MMNSEPRLSPNSTNITAVTLHDALQTGPNSYVSSSTDPETRCTHDSDTMSVEQELSKSPSTITTSKWIRMLN